MPSYKKLSVFTAFLLLFTLLIGCGSAPLTLSSETPPPVSQTNAAAKGETPPQIDENLTAYSFVWMSDTQMYSQGKPRIYMKMTNWIVENMEKMNFRYVFHTGDVVHRREEREQWVNADNAMKVLDGVIPYGILAGNHDVGWKATQYDTYLQYFGKQRFEKTQQHREYYNNGMATAEWLNIGETQYLFLSLGYNLGSASLYKWANTLLAENPDCIVILATHEYLEVDGSRTERGEKLFQKVIKPNKNVRMVLCGHNHTSIRSTESIDDDGDGKVDRNLIQLLSDYQTADNGGNGYLRILTVHEKNRTLEVKTYSPHLNKYNCFDPAQDSFSLSISDWFDS